MSKSKNNKILVVGEIERGILEEKVLEMAETQRKSGKKVGFTVVLLVNLTKKPLFLLKICKENDIKTELYKPLDQDLPLDMLKLDYRTSYVTVETIKRMVNGYVTTCIIGEKVQFDLPRVDGVDYISLGKEKRKYIAWDLELANTNIPEDFSGGDLFQFAPMRISCGAVAFKEGTEVITERWWGEPETNKEDIIDMLKYLESFHERGYTILSFNGVQFDFRVCAEATGEYDLCKKLAMNHYDLMYDVFLHRGYFASLDSILKFHGRSKKHEVTLKDGTVITDMSGGLAPRLWAKGETDAVLEYLDGDVTELLNVMDIVDKRQKIEWYSQKGNYMKVATDLLLVGEGIKKIKKPNTSWMTDPVTREQTTAWMSNAL